MASFCSKCFSTRMCNLHAKCSDRCSVEIQNKSSVGYVPPGLGVGSGDYIQLSFCLECGHIDGKWPKEHHELEDEIKDS